MSILEQIFAYKQLEIAALKQAKPLQELQAEVKDCAPARDFIAALRAAAELPLDGYRHPALIAEVKHASPSRGILVQDFDPLRLARVYQENGAAAISVLTDERYFGGKLEFIGQIAALSLGLPLLRKDFLCDPYQLYEARLAGADAVLLIAAALESGLLRDLYGLAFELQMAPLVEVHNLDELTMALDCRPLLVGINNRNLHDFSTTLETTLALRPHIPPEVVVVAESGIHTPQDIHCLAMANIDAVLVGEALVTAPDVAAQARRLAGLS
jgi:indole-3-glycerol phosphate synthase